MQEKEKGGFSFINEQIKEKPLNKKRLINVCFQVSIIFTK